MFLKLPKQNKFYVIFLAILCSGFLFFGNVNATWAAYSCTCTTIMATGEDVPITFDTTDQSECTKQCTDLAKKMPNSTVSYDDQAKPVGGGGSIITTAINWLLLAILGLAGLLLSMAITIFEWCVNPAFWPTIFDNPAIYACWGIVRDLLNISFIIVLLYTAFTIIFQVDSTGKKTLLTIVLMALLVNFSFPIARFIIDISNSLMYTIISANGTSGALGSITKDSLISEIIKGNNASTIELLASIVFVFILAITLLAVGLLLLIRMLTLVILVIFSPIAFVAKIMPETKGYATDWWKQLFNNAIFGPAMLLGVFVAMKMMENMGGAATFFNQASKQSISANLVGAMSQFTIPIIILWLVMGMAKKFSIIGADAVMGRAQKFAKWVPNATWKSTGISGGAKKGWGDARKSGKLFGAKIPGLKDGQSDRETKLAALISGGRKGVRDVNNKTTDADNKEAIKNASEKYNGETERALHADIKNLNAATIGAMDAKALHDAAGKVKQALSRGSAYERAIEADLKTITTGTAGLSGAAKPINVTRANITGNASADALEKDREKREKEAMDKWIREEKSALMDQARAVIKEAENKGKTT